MNFQLHTKLSSGVDCSIEETKKIIQEYAYKNVLIFVDEGVKTHSDYFNEYQGSVRGLVENITVLLSRGNEEPDYDYVDEMAQKVRELDSLDLVIGIGGGSCMDVAKVLAALYTNPGPAIDYRGFDNLVNPNVPTILIPTTAGTGSEATINASFVDKKEMKKMGVNGLYMSANYAILDANWLISCPFFASLSSGLDAMVHTLESFMAKQHTDISRIFSKKAFENLFFNLATLIDDPKNLERLQLLLEGSYYAGVALFNSGSGISGAISYPLGVFYQVPHGIAGGLFLPDIIHYNIKNDYRDFSELYDIIKPNNTLSIQDKNRLFAEEIDAIWKKLNVFDHGSLKKWGLDEVKVDELKPQMMAMQAAFDQNPIAFNAETQVSDLLLKYV